MPERAAVGGLVMLRTNDGCTLLMCYNGATNQSTLAGVCGSKPGSDSTALVRKDVSYA